MKRNDFIKTCVSIVATGGFLTAFSKPVKANNGCLQCTSATHWIDIATCNLCEGHYDEPQCSAVCPLDAVFVGLFNGLHINDDCVGCDECVDVCPVQAVKRLEN